MVQPITKTSTSGKPRGRPPGPRKCDVEASIDEWRPIFKNLDQEQLLVTVSDPIASLAAGKYLGVPAMAFGLHHSQAGDKPNRESLQYGQTLTVKSSFASKLYLALVIRTQLASRGEKLTDFGCYSVYQTDLYSTSAASKGVQVSLFRRRGTSSETARMALNLMLGEVCDSKSFLRMFQTALTTLKANKFIRVEPNQYGRGKAKRVESLPKWQLALTEQDRALMVEPVSYKSRGMNTPNLVPVPTDLVRNGWLAMLEPKTLQTLFAFYYQRVSTPSDKKDGSVRRSWFLSSERRIQCGLSEDTYRRAHRRLVDLGILRPTDIERYADRRGRGGRHDQPHEFVIDDARLAEPPEQPRKSASQ